MTTTTRPTGPAASVRLGSAVHVAHHSAGQDVTCSPGLSVQRSPGDTLLILELASPSAPEWHRHNASPTRMPATGVLPNGKRAPSTSWHLPDDPGCVEVRS